MSLSTGSVTCVLRPTSPLDHETSTSIETSSALETLLLDDLQNDGGINDDFGNTGISDLNVFSDPFDFARHPVAQHQLALPEFSNLAVMLNRQETPFSSLFSNVDPPSPTSGLSSLSTSPGDQESVFGDEFRKPGRSAGSCPDFTSLQTHKRATSHKPYLCSELQCGRRYARLDTLTRHKATHRAAEAHVCEICKQRAQHKAFSRKDHLQQHMRVCHSNAQRSICMSRPKSVGSPGYQSRAVQDIVHALKTMYGDDNDALRTLEQIWDLHQGSTTEQLAGSLAQLARREPRALASCSTAPLPARHAQRKEIESS